MIVDANGSIPRVSRNKVWCGYARRYKAWSCEVWHGLVKSCKVRKYPKCGWFNMWI